MAQALHLSQKMTLSQVLAPQLQQSLALLQAPTLELKAMVEQELQQNPVLEEEAATEMTIEEKEGREDEDGTPAADPAEPPADVTFDPATEKNATGPVDDFQAEFERLTQLDQEWRDHFAQTNIPMRQSQEEEEKRQFMFDSLVAGTSLQENLLEQIRLSDLTGEQQQSGELIVGNIDDYGYLQAGVDELAFATNIRPEKILEVLKVIQSFHRAGDDFTVTTNNEHVPHLRISNTYKDLMAQADSSAEVREYIREKIRPENSSSKASISASKPSSTSPGRS